MNVGFVGLGLIGFKRAYSLPSDANIIFGIDPSKSARKSFEKTFHCEVYEELNDELFKRVDALFICTIHQFLAPIACKSISKGLHTFVEKPGAINYESVLKIKKEFDKKNNTCLSFGFNHRFHPAFQYLKNYIEANNLNDQIRTVRGNYGHGGRKGYETEWRMNPEKSGGGELLDQGSHLIDLLIYLSNKDFEVEFAKLRNIFWGGDVEDNASIILKSIDEKIFANFNASWTEWKNNFLFEIFTKDIQFSVKGLGGSYGVESLTIYEMGENLGPPKTTIFEYPGNDNSWQIETSLFFDNIKNDIFSSKSLDDTMKLHAIVDYIYNCSKCSCHEVH
tara:strand:+ start:4557 stop:5561 length:1005 start_codon:yes stop_codon:yes gene_type:complete